MTQVISNSGHDDMIHDAVLDYYGRRLATCSSDKTIKIFEVDGESHKLTETLKGHDGAVWCVAWAHPKFGNILASASYDGKVFIWREQNGQWQRVFDFSQHTASVNGIAWADHSVGCILACASSDGRVSVLEFKDNSWTHQMYHAHGLGVNAVSWAPAITNVASSQGGSQQPVRRFVTGGSDNLVKIWEWSSDTKEYSTINTLSGHQDWVRDVAFSPTILSRSYIASASQDKTVRIWTADPQNPAGEWKSKVIDFQTALWRVSWSLSGNVLAVSGGDNRVTLWKESLKGDWECVKSIEE